GARVVRNIIDQDGAGATLGSVAAHLGAGQAQFVAQRAKQSLLLHHVDAAVLAGHVQCDQALDGAPRRCFGADTKGPGQVPGGGDSASGDDSLDHVPSRETLRCVVVYTMLVFHHITSNRNSREHLTVDDYRSFGIAMSSPFRTPYFSTKTPSSTLTD